jgi:hypothetical protein
MLNASTFGDAADICMLVHLVRHACQHLRNAIFAYYRLLAANQSDYGRGLFLKKTWRVSLSIGVRIAMIRCLVCLLRIFKNVSRTYE